jgi:hypothetical protein
MFILFQVSATKTAGRVEKELTEEELKVTTKILNQLNKAGVSSEKLEKLGDEQISIYLILTGPEKKIAERAFSKLGFKVEFSDKVDKAYLDLWEECKNKHQDNVDAAIDEFVERANKNFATTAYFGIGKPKVEGEKGDGNIFEIKTTADQLNVLKNKANELGKQIEKEAQRQGVDEKREESNKKQEEKKEDKQTKDQLSFEESFKVGSINFNGEDKNGGKKLDNLLHGKVVEYNCKGQSLIGLQNELNNKFKDYDFTLYVVDKNGQKREVSKLSKPEKDTSQKWAVTLEYRKKEESKITKNEESSSRIDLSNDESYKWLESNIFRKGNEISPKLLRFKKDLEEGKSEINMEKFKSSLDVDTIKEKFQAIADKYGYSMKFSYVPDAKNAGLHEFTIKFTKKDTSTPSTNVQTSTSTATATVPLSTSTTPGYNVIGSTQTAPNPKG